MPADFEALLAEDPRKWIEELPAYQRKPMEDLLAQGLSFDQVAEAWVGATTANTYRFSASAPVQDKDGFLKHLKREIRGLLCGDVKYQKERDGLFAEKGLGRTFVVSIISAAIAPHLSVAPTVIVPLIVLILASMGKVTLNAWCEATEHTDV